MKILEFKTRQEAQEALVAINQILEAFWIEQGYTVVNHQLVGKRNGVDNLEAVRTVSWAEIQESPDGTFYFSSPVTKYPAWRERLPKAFIIPEDREMPEVWLEVVVET